MSALSSGADYVYSRNAQCCVCMMQMYRDASTLACGHFVCEPCVDFMFRNGRSECPVCHADAAIVGEYREAAPQRGSDTNVFEVKLYKLAEDCPIATGEPISCKGCSALLTCYSTVLAQDTLSLWTCEFCGYPNKLTIDQAQIPSSNEVTYVLDPAPEVAAREPQGDATTCIFAIDVSGSMGCGVRVSTPISIKGGKPTNSPTRLDCVMAAVEAQINQMIEQTPDRHIGLVEFESTVTVAGDGRVSEGVQVGLGDFEGLVNSMAEKHDYYVGRSVAEAKIDLLTKVFSMQPKGMTALGPGLVVSVALAAQGKPGSKVIICTDGLANRGVGAVENLDEEGRQQTEKFYEDVGMWAQRSGVSVSVISVTSSECKLTYLSNISNLTEGNVLQVNPATLADDFANVLAERIIATEAKVRVTMHKGLKFKNESTEELQLQGSQLVRNIGNVSQLSSFTFEYAIKNEEEMTISEVDLRGVTQLPFQLVIEYRNLQGQRCVKSFAKVLRMSNDREEIERQAQAEVLYRNWGYQQGRRAEHGRYQQMREENATYEKVLERVAATEEQKEQSEQMMLRMRGIVQSAEEQLASEAARGQVLDEDAMDPRELQRLRRAYYSDKMTTEAAYFRKARK